MSTTKMSELDASVLPCPSCGKPMPNYGGAAGFICCDYKILYNAGGWFDDQGRHISDDRLSSGERSVAGLPKIL